MKSPAFFMYARDWLCSKTVRKMHSKPGCRGVSAYLYLLCESWIEEPPATLPSDPHELAAIARVGLDEWNQIWPMIAHQFESDGNGRIYCTKLMEIWKQKEAKSLAGRIGGKQNKGSASRKRKQKGNSASTKRQAKP